MATRATEHFTAKIIAVNTPAPGGKTMKSRLIKSAMSAACAIAPLAVLQPVAANAQTVTRPAQDITLSIGNGQLINVPGRMADVFVANEAVADVQIKSPNQFYLFGKGGGSTTVYASNAGGDVIWSATVRVGSNFDSVDSMLRLAMPEARIGVSTMGSGTFLLTGTVAAPEDAAEAERLVAAFVGNEANVISRLKTATPLQVNLQVRIAEVSRSLMRNINVNLRSMDTTGGFKFGIGQGRSPGATYVPGRVLGTGNNVQQYIPDPLWTPNPAFPIENQVRPLALVPGTAVTPGDLGTTLAGAGRLFGLDLIGALDAGEQVGLVTTLSQPNLTALSGETAEFLAGGEFPIPLSEGLGQTSVQFKNYGVSLSYTPTVLANGRISLRVRPEVSELSSQGAVVLGNFEIPALTVRRAETTVELGSGQSFMIAGLMSTNSQQSLDKMPGAGDVPILGALFRSRSYRRGETELVIIVTPYLVNPVSANEIALPTDGFKAPNAIQQLLGNMDQDGVSGGSRPKPTVAPSSEGTAPAPSIGAAERKSEKSSKRDRRASSDVPSPGFSLN